MLNSVKLLTNIGSVNVFDTINILTVYEGSYPIPFFIRLWQEDTDQRYIPATGATVTVEFLRMKTVGETNDAQDVVKALVDPYPEDRSIWGVSLISSDVANLITGGFRVTIVEGTDVTTIYSKMSIVKVPDSSWPLADVTVGSGLTPTSPVDSLWERISDVYYPKFLGDNVDLGTGDLLATDVTVRGTLYGGSSPFKLMSKESNVATGVGFEFDTEVALTGVGAYLQKWKNLGVDKWVIDKDGKLTVGELDADLVNITGTYGNIPSAPCDLETAISELSSAIGGENIWDRAGTTISPHIAGDDLDLGGGDILLTGTVDGRDVATDGAAFDLHITDDALIKHNADQIDVEGTYSGLPSTPSDLESTVGDIDSHVSDSSIHFIQAAIDHGNLLGRSDDDHTQYALVNGNRAFSAAISGVSPSSDSHLATKGYVDALIQGISWQEAVLNKTLVTSPLLPSLGDRHIIAGIGGDWSGFAINDVVEYDGVAWQKLTPVESFASWVEDEDVLYVYNGAAWVKFGSTVDHGNLLGRGDDDHTQYLLVSGLRPMSGDFDMNTHNIINVGALSVESLSLTAGLVLNRTAVAANYDVLITDYYLGVNTAAPRQIRLMSVIRSNGKIVEIKDESNNAGANNITVVAEGAGTIDGLPNYVINVNGGTARFICDGTNWYVL